MKKVLELNQHDFDNLLDWLAPNRAEAGEKYEQIRAGLVRFFRFRGCSDPTILADETINRVASRVNTLTFDNQVKVISIFYGFASKIYLEYISQTKKRELQFEPNLPIRDQGESAYDNPEADVYECLERCLGKLEGEENELVLRYYSEEKSARFALRRELASMLHLRVGALHTKVYRIRNVLKLCIEECLNEK